MKYECIICGIEFIGALYEDPCPCCGWVPILDGDVSSDDEIDYINHTSIREAKKKYAQGLDIFGRPIKQ